MAFSFFRSCWTVPSDEPVSRTKARKCTRCGDVPNRHERMPERVREPKNCSNAFMCMVIPYDCIV